MTKTVTRYRDVSEPFGDGWGFTADENGEWVRYEDIKHLLQPEPPREQLVVHHDEDSPANRAAAEKALRERGVQDIRHVTALDIIENKVRLRSDGFVVNRSGDSNG
jgi:hypothetical protein